MLTCGLDFESSRGGSLPACLPDGWVCNREGDAKGAEMSEVGKG